MTISDYVMIKINKDSRENISIKDLEAKIVALEHESRTWRQKHSIIYNTTKAQIEALELEIKKWEKDYASIYNTNKELRIKLEHKKL